MKTIIAIEGCDGSGKHTQAEMLHKYISGSELISFPDYDSDTGHIITRYLLGEYGDINSVPPLLISSVFALDRGMSFYTDSWGKDFYTKNNIVIADRYIYSNIIHQMSKSMTTTDFESSFSVMIHDDYRASYTPKQFMDELANMECCVGVPDADIVIYLDVPYDVSSKLMDIRYNNDSGKKDIHESNEEYMNHCREVGLYVMKHNGAYIINCLDSKGKMRSPIDIHKDIVSLLKAHPALQINTKEVGTNG